MKKQAYPIIGALVVTTLFAFSTARAQSASRSVADIPFAFSAGNQKLPAGKYVITATDAKIQRLRSVDGRYSTVLQMQAVRGKVQESGRLVFHRYGDLYFLAQTWTPADDTGLEAAKSRAERAAERELVGSSRKMEKVAISTR